MILVIRRLLGGAVAIALLVGVPYALATAVGWPLPTMPPSVDAIRWRLTNGQIPSRFWINALACIVWIAWAQLATSTVVELVATTRGRPHASLPRGFRWAQRVVAQFVAATVIGTVTSSTTLLPHMALAQFSTTIARLDPTERVTSDIAPDEPLTNNEIVVEYLDSLWGIAERTLGDGTRWTEIRALNAGRMMPDGTVLAADFTTVRHNWTLLLPSDAHLSAQADSFSVVGTRTVAPDDNFWTLAATTLADAWGREPTTVEIRPYWTALIDHNRPALAPPGDPNLIFAGQQFEIPAPPLPPEVSSSWDALALTSTDPITTIEPTPREAPPPRHPTPPRAGPDTPEPPPTTAPTTTTTVQIAPSESVLQPAGTQSHNRNPSPLLAAIAGCGVLAGGLVLTLRERRRRALRRRPAFATTPQMTAYVRATNETVRAVADTESVLSLDVALRYLAAAFADNDHPPEIVAANVSREGIELLLDQPTTPPAELITSDPTERAWRLDPTIDYPHVKLEGSDVPPYAPTLCTVGTTGARELLLDLETLRAVELRGDAVHVSAFLRAIALSLSANTWSRDVEVVAFGTNELPPSARCPNNPREWVDAVLRMQHARAEPDVDDRNRRLLVEGEPLHPTVVLVGPNNNELAKDLARATTVGCRRIAVVAAAPIGASCIICIEDPESATLEPYGLSFKPLLLQPAHVVAINDLASDDNEPDTYQQGTGERAPTDEPGSEPLSDPLSLLDCAGAIDAQILRRSPRVLGLSGDARGKLTAVIVFLAYHRTATSDRLRATFWPRASQRTFANNMAAVRKLLGYRSDGTSRLSDATNTHEYTIGEDVSLDWLRVQHLIAIASETESDESAALERALQQVDGWPLADAADEHYHWLLDDPTNYRNIETTLLDAAERLGELAMQHNNVDLGRWAVRQGHLVVPGQESLYRLRMRIEHQAGNRQGVIDAFADAVHAVEAIDSCDEVQPETRALYRSLSLTNHGLPGS